VRRCSTTPFPELSTTLPTEQVGVDDESVRREILLDLEAIGSEHPLTEAQQRLWDAVEMASLS